MPILCVAYVPFMVSCVLVAVMSVVPGKALGRMDVTLPWDWAQTAGRRTAGTQWSGSVPPLWSPDSV